MSKSNAFFVDGPDHGTTRIFDGQPPYEFLVAMVIRQMPQFLIKELETSIDPYDPDGYCVAVYHMDMVSRRNTYIYVFSHLQVKREVSSMDRAPAF